MLKCCLDEERMRVRKRPEERIRDGKRKSEFGFVRELRMSYVEEWRD